MRYVILLALLLSGCAGDLYNRPGTKGKCGTYKTSSNDSHVVCF